MKRYDTNAATLALLILSAVPLLVFLCLKYVEVEHPAYYWDYGLYWEYFKNIGNLVCRGNDHWPQYVLSSIRNDDYNTASVVPLSPFYCLFGGGRDVYLIAVSLTYLLPVVVIATWMVLQCVGSHGPGTSAAAFLVALTYIPFWAPTLRGMVDVCGLVSLGLATVILFKSDFLQRRVIASSIAMGVFLWLAFLLRRWYAYSVVVFFAAAFAFGVVVRWRASDRLLRIVGLTLSLLLAGIVASLLLFAFQSNLAARVLSTSYSELYEAYQVPFLHHFVNVLHRTGWFMVAMVAVGAAASIITLNTYALFCLVAAAGTFLFFTKTQALGPHHFLPIAFWLLPAYFLGLGAVSRGLVFLPKSVRIVPAVLLSMAVFALSISPAVRLPHSVSAFFLPTANSWPLHLENYREYRRLVADLKSLVHDDERIVVFASSDRLSDALLIALAPSLRRLVSSAPHIASLDLFPADLLRANYAIATDPPQTHLAAGAQSNLTIPNAMLLEGAGIGSAFERKPEAYKLADGVTAYLFERRRALTAGEVESFMAELLVHYPEWRERYRKSMAIPFAARKDVLGDVWGMVRVDGPNTLFMHPGEHEPTSVSLQSVRAIGARPSALKLSVNGNVLNTCPNADGVTVTLRIGSATLWSGDVLPGAVEQVDLPPAEETLTLTADKRSQVNCDHLLAEFEFAP